MPSHSVSLLSLLCAALSSSQSTLANVSDLWLGFTSYNGGSETLLRHYQSSLKEVVCLNREAISPLTIACETLSDGLSRVLAQRVPVVKAATQHGAVTVSASDEWALLSASSTQEQEHFEVRSSSCTTRHLRCVVITARAGRGALWAVYHLLFALQRQQVPRVDELDVAEAPASRVRIWQMWDNLVSARSNALGPHMTPFVPPNAWKLIQPYMAPPRGTLTVCRMGR